jgi:protoheme IX farnesyltransferase
MTLISRAINFLERVKASDYIALTKTRVMSLVVFSGFAGLVMAPGNIHPFKAFVAIVCIALGSGASAAINMWYDRDIDAIMTRTQNRPLVTGRILPEEALAFGVILGAFSVLTMALFVSFLASLLLLVTILFYVFIYTMWLKRRTMQNIVIGGAAGAFPPMIGWAAVTGNISFESFSLFLLIFMWTPPHFWSLALYQSQDYRKCNIPMMPVAMGDDYTKKQIVIYTALTVIASIIPAFIGLSSLVYAVFASVLGSFFLYYAVSLLPDTNNLLAPRMFFFSILYLFSLFFIMILDHYLKI